MAAKEQHAFLAAGSPEDYEADFFEWTQSTADLIRQGRLAEVDWEHVAEEIADMGLRDRREVRSRLIVLISHLLKWQYQPELRGKSWRATIVEQRTQLELVVEDSPSLRSIAREDLSKLFPKSVDLVAEETGIDPRRFPAVCPFAPEQILDPGFFPESN
jgi:hypothetical protein